MKQKSKVEFGDFQTPLPLARLACSRIASLRPRSVIEPTCGVGSFVFAAVDAFPEAERILGFDVNPLHLKAAEEQADSLSSRIKLAEADFFSTDWSKIVLPEQGPWLILGNPPWVTSSGLGALSSTNLPPKSNFQGRSGLDAVTGSANFDISEWMLLQALEWIGSDQGTIAVLCKTAVARKVLRQAWSTQASVVSASIYSIDAMREFGAAVDACFFVLMLGPDAGPKTCAIYDSLCSKTPVRHLGFDATDLISDIDKFDQAQRVCGKDPKYQWRSGVKHDSSKIMELRYEGGILTNGFGEKVEVEAAFRYPLLKSSDIGNGRTVPRGEMIVTQMAVGEDTSHIQIDGPSAWDYLNYHGAALDRRGSVIYKSSPRFSIFGVGAYTFAPWKVAISGFYKTLNFVVVGPHDGRPVVFDDTIYFLPCTSENEAIFIRELLESEVARSFFDAFTHWDEKRPITVSLLKRLNLKVVADLVGRSAEYTAFPGSLAFASPSLRKAARRPRSVEGSLI